MDGHQHQRNGQRGGPLVGGGGAENDHHENGGEDPLHHQQLHYVQIGGPGQSELHRLLARDVEDQPGGQQRPGRLGYQIADQIGGGSVFAHHHRQSDRRVEMGPRPVPEHVDGAQQGQTEPEAYEQQVAVGADDGHGTHRHQHEGAQQLRQILVH